MLEQTLETFSVLELAAATASKLKQVVSSMDMDDLLSLIALLTSMLSDASSDLNSRRPISRLPNEVLLQIFQSCERTKTDSGILWPMSSSIYARFPLSHVCRRWRDVAFSWPFLWADIHFDGSNYDAACRALQLSQDLPIHLTLKLNATLKEPIVQDCISRVQEIHILCDGDSDLSTWDPDQDIFFHNTSIAPRLERLSFILNPSMDPNFVDKFGPLRLADRSPNLKRLSFEGVSQWLYIQSKCLTHLSCADCHVNLLLLSDVLSANPRLEELILWECSADSEDLPWIENSVIQLDHMQRLVIAVKGDAEGMMLWLSRHVEVGPATSVRLHGHSSYNIFAEIRVTAYHQHIRDDIHTVALVSTGSRFHTIGVTQGSESGVWIEDTRSHGLFRTLLPLTLSEFPSVRELWLPIDKHGNYVHLVGLRSAFPLLETLVLCQEHIQFLLSTFAPRPLDECPCPNIKAVHIFVRQVTDNLARDLDDFATMVSTWSRQPLTVFNVGFPDVDTMAQFRDTRAGALEGPPVYSMKLFADMLTMKMPPTSATDQHAYWQRWPRRFPLRSPNN